LVRSLLLGGAVLLGRVLPLLLAFVCEFGGGAVAVAAVAGRVAHHEPSSASIALIFFVSAAFMPAPLAASRWAIRRLRFAFVSRPCSVRSTCSAKLVGLIREEFAFPEDERWLRIHDVVLDEAPYPDEDAPTDDESAAPRQLRHVEEL
jgi:hypothetical protein